MPTSSFVFDDGLMRKYVNEEKIPQSKIPTELRVSFKERLAYFLEKRNYWRVLEVVQCIVSIGFTVDFIVEAYLVADSSQPYLGFYISDLVLCGITIILFLLQLAISNNRLKFLFFNLKSYLDYITVIPLIVRAILYFIIPEKYPYYEWLGIFRLIRLFRLATLIHYYRFVNQKNFLVQLMLLLITTLALVIGFSGALIIVEKSFNEQYIAFHTAVYFMFVTLATIGYGDVSVKSVLGRYLVIGFFLLGAVIIPYMIKTILDILTSKHNLFRIVNFRLQNHVILTGNATYSDVLEFVKEFFHENHGKLQTKKLLLVFNDPALCEELMNIVNTPRYYKNVGVYNGNIRDHDTLVDLKIEKAKFVFILTNQSTPDPRKQDTNTLMITLALKNYNFNLKIHAQVILPESKTILIQSGASVVVCTEDLKLKIMTISMICDGFNTLISNLITSLSVRNVMEEYEKQYKKNVGVEKCKHMFEYLDGTSHGIHIVRFSSFFAGICFVEAALMLYQDHSIILIGINKSEKHGVLINPSTYLIEPGDDAICVTKNAFQASLVQLYKCNKTPKRNVPVVSLTSTNERASVEKEVIEQEEYYNAQEQTAFERAIDRDHELSDTNFRLRRGIVSPASDISTQETDGHQPEQITWYDVIKLCRSIMPISHVRRFYGPDSSYSTATSEFTQPILNSIISKYNMLLHARSERDFLMKNYQGALENHIIVSGSQKGAVHITAALRTSPIHRNTPIIFMSADESLVPYLYDRLKFFKNVYFMTGSPLEKLDLRRAGISAAYCIMHLSEPSNHWSHDDDSDAAKCLLNFSWFEGSTRYLCEISHRANIKYLISHGSRDVSTMSRKYMDILRTLTHNTVTDRYMDTFEVMCLTSEVYTSGRVFPNTVFARLLCQSLFNPSIVSIIEHMCGFSTFLSKQMSVMLIPCPPDLADRTFGDVFIYFNKLGVTLLGLYRPKNCAGPDSNHFEYCYCNPVPKTIVAKEDRMYVISDFETLKVLQPDTVVDDIEIEIPSINLRPSVVTENERKISIDSVIY